MTEREDSSVLGIEKLSCYPLCLFLHKSEEARKGGRPPRQRRAVDLQRVVKGLSSRNSIMANLLLSKLDNQLGILVPGVSTHHCLIGIATAATL
jgi:hypothetical protein